MKSYVSIFLALFITIQEIVYPDKPMKNKHKPYARKR